MAGKPKPMHQVKQIYLQLHQGVRISAIASGLGLSRNTVKAYRNRAQQLGLSLEEILHVRDEQLEDILQMHSTPTVDSRRIEGLLGSMDQITQDLKKKGVTRWLLWNEYRLRDPGGYSYSQFCWHLQQYSKHQQVSSVEDHQPGDKLYIDFAGKKMSYIDGVSGEIIQVPIFVAQLGFSKYSYIEATASERTEHVIGAMNRCLRYMGGAPRCLVPDNMKSAVIRSDRYEPHLNEVLSDFCNHYGMAIIPARVKKPRDKALAEQLVNHFYQQVLAPLRNQVFYSLEELNSAILKQLDQYNSRLFQKRDHSRKDLFISREKPALQLLTSQDFEIRKMREVTVRKNCFVELSESKNYYSVPYPYIGKKVRIIYTSTRVEIFCQGRLIAVHRRSFRHYQYVLISEHLPSHLQQWRQRSPEYYRNRALKEGEAVQEVIDRLLQGARYPEVKYNSCEGILQLSRKTSPEKLNRACALALDLGEVHYSTIKRLVSSVNLEEAKQPEPRAVSTQKGRGARYYLNLFNQHIISIFTL